MPTAPTGSTAPSTDHLLTAFGLAAIDPESLSRFARVHRGRTSDGTEVVVKRTADRAPALIGWTSALAATGIPVVTPVPMAADNPRYFGASEVWVVYPFVAGEPYRATAGQLRAAGKALAAVHAAALPAFSAGGQQGAADGESIGGMRHYEFPDTEADEVEKDLLTLRAVFDAHAGAAAAALAAGVAARAADWHGRALPALRSADAAGRLPWVAATDDYKAVNLVYVQGRPVMVDPDNGGVLPRILDLALAVVLFHNECAAAPGRLFDRAEWAQFAAGYRSSVQLTDAELELWPDALLHQWWEEGTWALEDNDQQAWDDARQREFLLALAAAPLESFRW